MIQAVKTPARETETEQAESSAEKIASPEDIGGPYSKESIRKLFEDTKNIEKMLNQRLQDQNSAINQ